MALVCLLAVYTQTGSVNMRPDLYMTELKLKEGKKKAEYFSCSGKGLLCSMPSP